MLLAKFLTVAVSAFCIAQASDAVEYSEWASPGPGDVRSPCPGLNSLANHGIIPRNGKALTLPILVAGLQAGLNVGSDFAIAIGSLGILSSPNLHGGSFDLNDLDRHEHLIEHDASLSRGDVYFGNNYSFNETIFDTVLAYFAGQENVTISLASKARFNRVLTERARNPHFTYTARELILSYGETSLYLSTMGDPTTGVAPLEYVKILFEEERLPYNEGWRPPTTQTTMATLVAMIGKLNVASGEVVPEGLVVDESTLNLVLAGLDPIISVSASAPALLNPRS